MRPLSLLKPLPLLYSELSLSSCVVPCSLILSLTHSALYLGRILQQNADKAALQQEIQQLTQRIDALRAEVEALRAVVRQLTEQLQVLREEIARLEGEVQWT